MDVVTELEQFMDSLAIPMFSTKWLVKEVAAILRCHRKGSVAECRVVYALHLHLEPPHMTCLSFL